ncbi:CDP-archaeol synthase [Patescibacteria group bacterium]
MLTLILSALYLILPSYLANMCPVIFGKTKLPFAISISEKHLGKNKTWRGVYTAYFGALLILFIQSQLHKNGIATDYSLLSYSEINIFLYALSFGLGTIIGDSIKSFFKRRIGIKPGGPWIPFDQIDFILGTYVFLLPLYIMPWQTLLTLLLITPLLHLLANITGYLIGLKKVWW